MRQPFYVFPFLELSHKNLVSHCLFLDVDPPARVVAFHGTGLMLVIIKNVAIAVLENLDGVGGGAFWDVRVAPL